MPALPELVALRELHSTILKKHKVHLEKSRIGLDFLEDVGNVLNGPFAESDFLNTVPKINAFIISQATIYVTHLTAIEDASDDIGTDPFGTNQG